MCLGVPMRIVRSDGFVAVCESDGRSQTVSLHTGLQPWPEQGAWPKVGFPPARALTEAEAVEIGNAAKAVAAAMEGRDYEHLIQDLIDRKPEIPPGLYPAGTKDG